MPDQLDEADTEALGAAFAEFAGAPTVVVGHDMRPSSPDLAAAFAARRGRPGAWTW